MKINNILYFKRYRKWKFIKKWLEFREENLCYMDKKRLLNFDDYSKKILKNTAKDVYNSVSKQLDFMHDDFIDYCSHWNDKYYIMVLVIHLNSLLVGWTYN